MKRSTPLKRYKRLNPRRKTARRSNQLRSPEYLAFVRTLPCCALQEEHDVMKTLMGQECSRGIHAHHAGRRPGTGVKAPDDTAIPLCDVHHFEWHQAAGMFHGWSREQRREWADARIAETKIAFSAWGAL